MSSLNANTKVCCADEIPKDLVLLLSGHKLVRNLACEVYFSPKGPDEAGDMESEGLITCSSVLGTNR